MTEEEILAKIAPYCGEGRDKPVLGFYIGPGWYQIVADLIDRITSVTTDFKIEQVKEKFGGLRFYYITGDLDDLDVSAIRAYVIAAENKSFETCEETGKPGVLMRRKGRQYGWVRTLNPDDFGDEYEEIK